MHTNVQGGQFRMHTNVQGGMSLETETIAEITTNETHRSRVEILKRVETQR